MSQTQSGFLKSNGILSALCHRVPKILSREQGTNPGSIEQWIQANRGPLNELQGLIDTLKPELSDEPKVEITHSDESVLFCANHSAIKYLGLAEQLIREHFPTVRRIDFSLEYDPETTEKWVDAEIRMPGEIDEIIELEDEFVKEWVATVPYPERTMIRFSYDII
jgi:hypothetical protein